MSDIEKAKLLLEVAQAQSDANLLKETAKALIDALYDLTQTVEDLVERSNWETFIIQASNIVGTVR